MPYTTGGNKMNAQQSITKITSGNRITIPDSMIRELGTKTKSVIGFTVFLDKKNKQIMLLPIQGVCQ